MGYTHLTEQERYQIFILLKSGPEVATIAAMLKRHRYLSGVIAQPRGEFQSLELLAFPSA